MIKIDNKVQYLANRARVWEAYVAQINSSTGNNPVDMARALASLNIDLCELDIHLTGAYIRFTGQEEKTDHDIDMGWVDDVIDELCALGEEFFFSAVMRAST